MNDLGDKAREDFLSEAQEIVDGLSRDLLVLDSGLRVGRPDATLINEIFRAVHTLKGLAGLFGASKIGTLSHELEDMLDDLRMGRLELSVTILDALFRTVDIYGRLLATEKAPTSAPSLDDFDGFMRDLSRLSPRGHDITNPTILYDIDPSTLAVLTEYEEHRLKTCIALGFMLYRVRAAFKLVSIDEELEALKSTLKTVGEVLTYLPAESGLEADSIELDILVASHDSIGILRSLLDTTNVKIEEVTRKETQTDRPIGANTVWPKPPAPADIRAHSPIPTMPPGAMNALTPLPAPVAGPESSSLVQSREPTLKAVAQTVRVDIRKLDHLMNLLGELGIVRSALARLADSAKRSPAQRELGAELQRLTHGFERHLGNLQTGILEVRMVPLGQVFDRVARVVRQSSRAVDKEVNLVITGAETEVDKLIVEDISDPLMHMVRNALDHGIEAREEREAVGKPLVGTIALNAFQKGNQVVVEVEDDGAGIDEKELVEAAISSGTITREEAHDMLRRDALALLFLPGVTTKLDVSRLSGRGVGMDVVKTNIGKLGGIVDVQSELGIGTRFTITLPITLAIISALLVRVGEQVYALPLASVQEAVQIESSSVHCVEGRDLTTVRGESLVLYRLTELFRLRAISPPHRPGKLVVVVAAAAIRKCGFVVDAIIGRQDIIIKPLTGPLRNQRGFAGATELGDQRVALVVDMPGLIEEVQGSVQSRAGGAN